MSRMWVFMHEHDRDERGRYRAVVVNRDDPAEASDLASERVGVWLCNPVLLVEDVECQDCEWVIRCAWRRAGFRTKECGVTVRSVWRTAGTKKEGLSEILERNMKKGMDMYGVKT